MTAPAEFPRVRVPGLTDEQADLSALLRLRRKAAHAALTRSREGMVQAMLRRGYRPYLGHVYRAPKKTKNVRLMERLALRSTKEKSA